MKKLKQSQNANFNAEQIAVCVLNGYSVFYQPNSNDCCNIPITGMSMKDNKPIFYGKFNHWTNEEIDCIINEQGEVFIKNARH